jgi:hypothetical protein
MHFHGPIAFGHLWRHHAKLRAKRGGARRDRTADLLHAMQALSQLSYGPVYRRTPWVTCVSQTLNTVQG